PSSQGCGTAAYAPYLSPCSIIYGSWLWSRRQVGAYGGETSRALLDRAAGLLPRRCKVRLLADRGFLPLQTCWPISATLAGMGGYASSAAFGSRDAGVAAGRSSASP